MPYVYIYSRRKAAQLRRQGRRMRRTIRFRGRRGFRRYRR